MMRYVAVKRFSEIHLSMFIFSSVDNELLYHMQHFMNNQDEAESLRHEC